MPRLARVLKNVQDVRADPDGRLRIIYYPRKAKPGQWIKKSHNRVKVRGIKDHKTHDPYGGNKAAVPQSMRNYEEA